MIVVIDVFMCSFYIYTFFALSIITKQMSVTYITYDDEFNTTATNCLIVYYFQFVSKEQNKGRISIYYSKAEGQLR